LFFIQILTKIYQNILKHTGKRPKFDASLESSWKDNSPTLTRNQLVSLTILNTSGAMRNSIRSTHDHKRRNIGSNVRYKNIQKTC
jgi:hypothetical protein